MSRLKGTVKGLKKATKNTVNKVVDKYVESGAKGTVDARRSQISGKFDEISGQAMYQLVQERLAEQDRFNDLLATKLQEALERISDLEKRLAGK